jgi:hypothetical protein
VPEKAKAYLLDLLQGGGIALHTDYIDLVYRALHDLGESPRSLRAQPPGSQRRRSQHRARSAGEEGRAQRLIRTAVYERRAT